MSKNCPVHDNALNEKTDFQYFVLVLCQYTNNLKTLHAIRPEKKKNWQIPIRPLSEHFFPKKQVSIAIKQI